MRAHEIVLKTIVLTTNFIHRKSVHIRKCETSWCVYYRVHSYMSRAVNLLQTIQRLTSTNSK